MNDHFSVTVSDQYGSRFYSVSKSIKRNVLLGATGFLIVLATSAATNLMQFNHGENLAKANNDLDADLLRFDVENSNLNQIISRKTKLIEDISQELVEIEETSGVETADDNVGLDERVRAIAEFYNQKEEVYTEIGSRVQQIEGMIGLNEGDSEDKPGHENLSVRVELASLTASHEKILHDSIPNGFPTDQRVITSKYGTRIHPVTKIKSFHKGVDLRAKVGDSVYISADGIVKEANYSELSGHRIVVQHNFGFETRYSHLDKMLVEPGDIVHKGDLIALSGNTGRTNAAHLHYEVRYLGKSVDPYQFLKWEFGSHEIFDNVKGIKWPSLISLINKQITHQTLQLSQLAPTSLVK